MLTQLFQPEPNHLKGLEFARELMRRGHSVEVLTGYPNYPGGKIYPGYKMKGCQRETIDGVPILRVPLYPSHDRSGIKRFLCYSSFALSAGFRGISQVQQPDVVHVYQGPATLAWPAMMLRRRRGTPYVLDIQDLWPESVTSSGMMKVPGGAQLVDKWCRRTYRHASRIVVLSEGYRRVLEERGVPANKIDVVYNWSDERSTVPSSAAAEDPFGLAGGFNVVFAGNMGKVQALDAVIHAAAQLGSSHPEIRFVFVGGGVEVGRLESLSEELGLTNVRFIPRIPVERMSEVFAHADALLIHLKDDPVGRIGIPQKTQAYLAAGRPIVMAVHGDAAELVRRANAGVLCEPEDSNAIAEAVMKIVGLTTEERQELAANGKRFYDEHLCFQVGVNRMVEVLENATAATGA